MIEEKRSSLQYLKDYKDDKIEKGLRIGCELDDFVVYKRGQLNIILGHDNIGKSYWSEWYFLTVALRHGLRFVLLMDENRKGKVIRDMIQMYYGQDFMSLTHREIEECNDKIEEHFKFIDNRNEYTPEEVVQIFTETDCDAGFIDPYNGLNSTFNYDINYKNMRLFKRFTKQTNRTIYISAHPATASGRRGASYPESHEWAGHTMPPIKSDIEGGKPFTNKLDDLIIAHRLIDHKTMWRFTMIEVKKVKDTDTGGRQTWINEPLLFDYNNGHGFVIGGKDPLNGYRYHDDKKKRGERIGNELPFKSQKSRFVNNNIMDEEDDLPF